MLRLGVLPEGYIYPKEERMVRDLMRKRMQLVQQATQNLLSIQGLYMRHLSYKLSNNKIKQLTPEIVESHFSSSNIAQAIICNLIVMSCLKEQIKTLEKTVLTQVQLKPDFHEN